MPTAAATPVTYTADASISRFTVKQYQRMIETGILTPDDKVELLEGYVVLKMPRNPPHDGTIQLVSESIRPYAPAGWAVRVQLTVELSDSQPEPDIVLARGGPRTYMTRHPTVADVGLLIEVAHTSLPRDQRDKARIYARAGIPVYWIINLVDRRVEVYTQPSGPTAAPDYAAARTYLPGDLVPLSLDGTPTGPVPANDLLP